ncbi:hypothetical protein [Serratia sp. J2]|uniref:hypothetical protein n=1 Tax=Serratia TaxID=613 RepID=UPI00391744E6
MIKQTLIAAMSLGMVGCAGMKIPPYTEVKASPYYDECREFAADVYNNDGYSKLVNDTVLRMNEQKAQAIVSGCVVSMGKNSLEEAKLDMKQKAVTYGIISAACDTPSCQADTEQQLKAFTLGSFYATQKKFPEKKKVEKADF